MSAQNAKDGPDPLASKLEDLGVSHPSELIPLLQASNRERAATACSALGLTRKKAYAPLLLNILESRRRSLWMVAAAALSLLESKRAIRPLIRLMLDNAHPQTQRQAAAYALAFTWTGLQDARYATVVSEAFLTILCNPHESPGLRGQVAEGLAYLYGPCAGAGHDRRGRAYEQAGEPLVTALADPAAEVRFWSAFALGSMRYQKALPALRKLARTDRENFGDWWTVGEEATDAIKKIKGRPFQIRIKTGS